MKDYYKDQFRLHCPMVLFIDPYRDYEDGYEGSLSDTSLSLLSRRLADTVYEVDVIIAKLRSVKN